MSPRSLKVTGVSCSTSRLFCWRSPKCWGAAWDLWLWSGGRGAFPPDIRPLPESAMIRWFILKQLAAAERELGVSVDYMRHVLRVSLRTFLQYFKLVRLVA